MRILLLGANGQVGTELQRSLAPLGELVSATRGGRLADGTACKVADFDQPGSLSDMVERIAPDIVVNAAAYTAVDRAEEEIGAAFRANAESPRVLGQACASCDALLVHYSTDYVFDGRSSRPYREDDATSPLGVYGTSKLAGEGAIEEAGGLHLILRTGWVYASHGNNFLRTMLRLANQRDELRVVADQRGSPTPAWLIADVTARILSQGITQSGVRHLVTSGETSWYGFATAIMEQAHASGLIASKPRVLPITTADFPTPAQRPAYSVLDTALLRHDYTLVLPEWRPALDTTLSQLSAS